MELHKTKSFVFLIFIAALLSSCAENLPQDISTSYSAPTEFTFNTPYGKTWKKAVRAISEENRIRTLDKESGLIVTEYITVNKEILTMFQTIMFGRTYKNSYSVTITEESPGSTNVMVHSNLMMEQFALYKRERNVDWFEAYMRQILFKKICDNIYISTSKCESLFPNYHTTGSENHTAEAQNSTAASPIAESEGTYRLNPVEDVQKSLLYAGYDPGSVDGRMGKKTKRALRRFQQDHGLLTTGDLDQQTLIVLGL